jgi:hypothetical protein
VKARIGVGLVAVATAVVIVLAVIQVNKWYRACDAAGGRVEQRWEYASQDMTNHYDGKGNLQYISIDVDQHYSYHCWVGDREVLDSWMS